MRYQRFYVRTHTKEAALKRWIFFQNIFSFVGALWERNERLIDGLVIISGP